VSLPIRAASSWFLPALLVFFTFGPRHARAQQQQAVADPDTQTLKRLSIEELSSIDVTSTLKHAEPISGSAAAIAVITGDDIRRAGITTLPEALRLVTGVQVARFDGRTWAISARGFNISTANKLVVLVDGRGVYTPLFSGVYWDVQDLILEDVDRIEVVRGPGATLWGANAVNGVINIVTKPASQTRGTLVQIGGGSDLGQTAVRSASMRSTAIAAARCLRRAPARAIRCAAGRSASVSIAAPRGGR
jgi:iron complex outermembrane receptor protein